MTRRVFHCLALCVAGIGIAQPSLKAQEPTPVIPPLVVSPDSSATRITEKPVAFTPLEEAQKLYLMGEFDQAIKQYQSLLHGGSDDAVAYAGMARAYLKLKQSDEAYAAASKAVEIDPYLATAHSALGEVYFRQGQLYEAQTQFLFPFKLGPGDARSYLGLERLYRASFNFMRAKVAIDKAHELAPKDPEISGDWFDTRPLPERIQAMETLVDSPTNFYSRAEIADVKHHLEVLKDQAQHPDRVCRLVNGPESSEIPLVPAGDSDHPTPYVALQVAVNGAKSRLALSTEGSGITINDKIAEKAKVEEIVRTDLEGLGKQNPPESYVGFVRSIKVGAFEFQNCYITVVQHVAPGSFYDILQGTISGGLFRNYLVDFDIPHARLSLLPLPKRPETENADDARMDSSDPDAAKLHDRYTPPEMSAWTQLYQFGSVLAIPARINQSTPELFDISTVALNSVSPDFAEKWTTLGGGVPLFYGTNGRVDARWTGKVRLEFSGFYFDTPAETSLDLSVMNNQSGTQIYGRIGFEVLKNLSTTIDYRDGLIHFDNGQEHH